MEPKIEIGGKLEILQEAKLTLLNDWLLVYTIIRESKGSLEKFYVTRYRECDLSDMIGLPTIDESGVYKKLNGGKPYDSFRASETALYQDMKDLSIHLGLVPNKGDQNEN